MEVSFCSTRNSFFYLPIIVIFKTIIKLILSITSYYCWIVWIQNLWHNIYIYIYKQLFILMYNGLHVLNMTLMDDELMMKTICASCNKQIEPPPRKWKYSETWKTQAVKLKPNCRQEEMLVRMCPFVHKKKNMWMKISHGGPSACTPF